MTARINTAVFNGLRAVPATMVVTTESSGNGLVLDTKPLPANKETPSRVLNAIRSADLDLPSQRIRARLEQPHGIITGIHDLAIALGTLVVTGQLDPRQLANTLSASEVQEDGVLQAVQGLCPIARLASKSGQKLLSNRHQKYEADAAGKGRGLFAFNLGDMVYRLQNAKNAERLHGIPQAPRRRGVSIDNIAENGHAKRALGIAAAGGHHIVLTGPPELGIRGGLAHSLTSLMTEPETEETAEILTILSIAGLLDIQRDDWNARPCRFPHFTMNTKGFRGSITGRDRTSDVAGKAKPGETTLAHRGVLAIDELNLHRPESLDTIADAIIARKITNEQTSLPTDFILVAIIPGGFETPNEAVRTILDRDHRLGKLIQIGAYVERPTGYPDSPDPRPVTSAELQQRVSTAQAIQRKRYDGEWQNANVPEQLLEETLNCTRKAQEMITARKKFGRAHSALHVARVARTLADMRAQKTVTPTLIDQASTYVDGIDYREL